VVDTHLHFDHCGGNTFTAPDDDEQRVQAVFPNARYVAHRREVDYAQSANERTQASYLAHNYEPIAEAGLLELLSGPSDIVPGISVFPTPGHTPHHQSVLVRSGAEAACFMADVIPTMAHLPLPWIMGYDVEPLVTLESKRRLLTRAARENWLLVSTHDPVHAFGRVEFDGATVEFTPLEGAAGVSD